MNRERGHFLKKVSIEFIEQADGNLLKRAAKLNFKIHIRSICVVSAIVLIFLFFWFFVTSYKSKAK